MKVFVRGQACELRRTDFLSDGGEGNVYVRGSTAFKIYHSPAQMIPKGKMAELAAIRDARVLRPLEEVVDPQGTQVGYTMHYASQTHVLCRVIPRSFRERHGIDADRAFELVLKLRQGMENVHRAGVLIVDVNVMNFLVNASFDDVFFIDVDSYQTRHYPATAILPSVRDWHCSNGFDEGSDWFSFAVLSFQLLTGLHPYKGKHAGVRSLEERIQQNLSVFDPAVSTPGSWYGLDVIPENFRHWYRAVLQDGQRLPPPVDGTAPPVVVSKLDLVPSSALHSRDVFRVPFPILGVTTTARGLVVWTGEGVYLNGRRVADAPEHCFGVGYVPTTGTLVAAALQGGKLVLANAADGSPIPVDLRADEGMVYQGQVYVRCHDKMVAVRLLQVGPRVVAAPQMMGQVLPFATTVWPGVVLQNLLGAVYAHLYPRLGEVRQIRLPQLDESKILSAAFQRAVLVVRAVRRGEPERWVFRFDGRDFRYDARKETGEPPSEASFAVLDTEVCVCACGDDALEISAAQQGKTALRRIENTGMAGRALFGDGHRLLCHEGGTLRQLSLK
jgi:hypothetical protein